MINKVPTLCIIPFLALTSLCAQAEIYKWVDANGETHFSERKPDTAIAAESVDTRNVTAPKARETWREQDTAFQEQKKAADEAAQEQAKLEVKASQKKANCEQARKRAVSLERPRVNKVEADGTRVRMPEEWRQEQISEAAKKVADFCS